MPCDPLRRVHSCEISGNLQGASAESPVEHATACDKGIPQQQSDHCEGSARHGGFSTSKPNRLRLSDRALQRFAPTACYAPSGDSTNGMPALSKARRNAS